MLGEINIEFEESEGTLVSIASSTFTAFDGLKSNVFLFTQ